MICALVCIIIYLIRRMKMDMMKAYVFKDVGNLVYEEKPIPHVKDPDDVLLKVKAVGICGSDLKII